MRRVVVTGLGLVTPLGSGVEATWSALTAARSGIRTIEAFDVSDLPAPIRAIFESAFGDATGHIFLVALPFAIGALVAVLLIKEVPLRTSVMREDELMAEAASDA